jgi:predicted phosphodiesterase
METPMITLLAIVAAALAVVTCIAIIRRGSARLREEARDPAVNTSPFVVKPMIQLGARDGKAMFEIVFAGAGVAADYKLRVYADRSGTLDFTPTVSYPVNLPEAQPKIPVHKVFRVPVSGLEPGERFSYRINYAGNQVFAATAQAPTAGGEKTRIVVTGDIAKWGADERRIANRAYQEKPNMIVLVGDIAYDDGRIIEYFEKFLPAYNADQAADALGAPILRSIMTVAVAGNHCVGRPETMAVPDFNEFADHFAYFVYWAQPLNAPVPAAAAAAYGKDLIGPKSRKDAVFAAAGERAPAMLNFSFDHGDAHWVVLDSNRYMDWTDPVLREWLEKDLMSTTKTWKFVTFHHSCFHSSRKHQDGVRMRLVADIFQKCGVDIVFTGHVHTYERTFPLTFTLKRKLADLGKTEANDLVAESTKYEGDLVLDKEYDGVTNTRPKGVIYLTTGAGGAPLHSEAMPEELKWQPQTCVAKAGRHSLTVLDMIGPKLVARQLTAQGEELDRFEITK